jgi:cysteine sulfinate desulfinase/cysteine desulfurase-like protein
MRTIWIIAALALVGATQAWAVRVGNEPPPTAVSAQSAAPTGPATGASHADDSSSLRQGTISAVNANHDQIEVNGSWLKIAAGQTRVFRQGRAVESDVFAKGQAVKFTLLPGQADRFTLGVVYVP